MSQLHTLYSDIGARTGAIEGSHSGWPCRKGCDDCCRSLAAIPELTVPELEHIERGLRTLSPERQDAISGRLRTLGPERPVVCPFLDSDAGACLIYEYRPAACRTYGFYVERDKGLYCNRIEAADTEGVIWGNQCTVDAKLDALGPRFNIREWFERQTA